MSDDTTETTWTRDLSAADNLRAEIEAVNASRGTIITFVYDVSVKYPETEEKGRSIQFIAISNGENWGVTSPRGGGDYVPRSLSHANLVKVLAAPEVTSATVLVPGEAFKP